MAAKVAEKFALKNSPHSWRFSSNGPTLERSMRRTGPAAAVSLSPAEVLAADAAPEPLAYPRGTTFLVILAVAAISVGAEIALIKGPTGTLSVGICAMALAMGMTAAASARHRRAIAAAITQERHRIAREIHDGLAQELAYIRMEVLRMAALGNDERVNRLALAAERALEESRGAIATLRRDHDSSFSRELTEVAEELTDRAGARLSLRLQPGLEIQPELGRPWCGSCARRSPTASGTGTPPRWRSSSAAAKACGWRFATTAADSRPVGRAQAAASASRPCASAPRRWAAT